MQGPSDTLPIKGASRHVRIDARKRNLLDQRNIQVTEQNSKSVIEGPEYKDITKVKNEKIGEKIDTKILDEGSVQVKNLILAGLHCMSSSRDA